MKRKCTFPSVLLLATCTTIARQSVDETTPATPPAPEPSVIASPEVNGVVVEPERHRLPALKIEKVGERPVPSADPATRAWSTTVGWRPGASAFPDPLTHEAQLNLIAVPPWLNQLSGGD
jgi:hypothetical protein